MTPVDGRARVAQRSLLATLEITAAAGVAHALGGGHLPAPGFIVAFGAVVFGCCWATIGRFLRVGLVVPLVLVAQLGLHLAFDAAPGAGHHSAAPHGAEGLLGQAALTPVMLWAHVITAVVTAILLLLQERVIAAVAGRCALASPPLPPRSQVLLTTASAVLPLFSALVIQFAPRRGPPALLVAPH